MAELNPEYIQKMEDVLATYEKPYQAAEPVVCLDEKPVSLHADVRPPMPTKPGKPAKQDNEYKRCGTANVFGVVEPKAGRHFTAATHDRCAAEFARMLGHVVEQYMAAETIHLVMDNPNIHCRKSLTDCFGEQEGGDIWDRLIVHHTPKHGSWLNQAEIELSLFSRQCLSTRRIPNLGVLKRETKTWKRKANQRRTTNQLAVHASEGQKAVQIQVPPPRRLTTNTTPNTFSVPGREGQRAPCSKHSAKCLNSDLKDDLLWKPAHGGHNSTLGLKPQSLWKAL